MEGPALKSFGHELANRLESVSRVSKMDVLSRIVLFTVLGTSPASRQSTQEYLQHLVGQRFILRHHAGSSNPKVEQKGHSIKKGDCDQAVEVMTVAFEKAAVRLQLRNIGAPVVGNKSADCSLEPLYRWKLLISTSTNRLNGQKRPSRECCRRRTLI
jgi:hypothetical protein